MKKYHSFVLGFVGILIITLALAGSAFAQNPYTPTADTYTSRTNPNTNYGTATGIFAAASSPGGCIENANLWFKFDIPNTSATISTATLSMLIVSGSGQLDLELRSSATTNWIESGLGSLTWNNQPAFEQVPPAAPLATASSVAVGSRANFGGAGSALATYLNAHKGQTVTLVVRGDCAGKVTGNAQRGVYSKEYSGGSGVTLSLLGPTSIGLQSFSADSGGVSTWSLLSVAGVLLLAFTLCLALRRNLSPARRAS